MSQRSQLSTRFSSRFFRVCPTMTSLDFAAREYRKRVPRVAGARALARLTQIFLFARSARLPIMIKSPRQFRGTVSGHGETAYPLQQPGLSPLIQARNLTIVTRTPVYVCIRVCMWKWLRARSGHSDVKFFFSSTLKYLYTFNFSFIFKKK